MPAEPRGTLLLVEDAPGHARLIERNVRRALLPHEIVTLSGGPQAVDDLWKEQTYAGARQALPLFLLLDVHLPGLPGSQVLTRLKTEARPRHIPVMVLTTTEEP